ncbi:DMT family transporter [Paenibacillus sp. NFR01]|uniref:DMT family transporter n=1 Tax=Paenibacillus sp. NFR01 TaxID=1566279 RepID=UPI0008C8B3FA|nr:EamA family transporter [Paenibacillus sp. NFR01]SET97850.1 Permease of the drug/metabolite transporter (DMT) superfamily [Paenibacillus sp. NFR01]
MILLAYSIVCLIFGTTFLAIKVGVDAGLPPFFSAGVRFFLAGCLILLWARSRGKTSFSLLLRKEMLITGAALSFGTFSCLYWAEQYVSSGLAAVLSATGPMMILLMQTAALRQKPSRVSLYGCIIGFAGVILLVLPSLALDYSPLWLTGCVVVLIGECCYAGGAIYSKKVTAAFSDVSPIALNAAQMLYGGALLLVLSMFTETGDIHPETLFALKPAGALLYLTIAGSMVGHSLFYWLVARTNPVFPSTWLYVSPPIAVGVGYLFYGEAVTWLTLLGVLTILAGTILVNVQALKGMLSGKLTGKAGAAKKASLDALAQK